MGIDGCSGVCMWVLVHVCMCTCADNRQVTLEVWGARAFDMNEREGHLSSGEKG